MDLKQIEKMMVLMNRHGVSRLAVKEEGLELELEKQAQGYPLPPPAYPYPYPSTSVEEESKASHKEVGDKNEGGNYITSPMVGTYYASATPDAPPFIKVGDQVKEESIVCIIEAMKVMNEIKAGVSGVVKEILVKNGAPLEFGTKIIKVV